MKRRLGFLEASMYAGADTPVNVVFPVKITGEIEVAALVGALQKIRQKHPFLNVTMETDAKGIPWYVTSGSILPIPLRIVDRLSEETWIDEAETEWDTPFNQANLPLARIAWVRSNEVSELLVVCHHCIGDATSAMTIMRELLECLGDPTTELRPYPAFSPEALVPAAVRRNILNRLAGKTIAGITRLFLLAVSGMKEVVKDRFYTIRWKLSEEETTTLLSVCREKGIHLNTALILAFMRAFERASNVRTSGRMFASVDMRRFLPEIEKDHLFPFPSMVGLKTPGDKNGFREQANALKASLHRQLEQTDAARLLLFSEYLVPLYPRSIKYAKAGKGGHDFAFANIGRIPLNETYGQLAVAEVHCPLSRFPMGNPSKVSVSTFRGRMDFAFHSEEKYIARQDAEFIIGTAMKLLKKHLPETKPLTILDLK
ncbi:condensation domain-containing protein [Dyadobacter jiangsuensis]|uniref:Condensation domain-containing protein n=1 Tax=Dyadobacter jiangsuensis TaxID=1591085 RepID=A0A2P8G207_9BACT|nr:condensation domain-containing protein [Dyadobacter jiangsuensis]PSL28020.1 condensation domain-containing protein [Dyadobacter jiangsuensis]